MACLTAWVGRNVPSMKRAPLIACLFAAAVTAHAQQQEQGLIDRIDAKRQMALKSMDGSSKPNPALASPLANKAFGTSSSIGMKTFDTSNFSGVKGAEVKTFETRSFFGVKNPWFGNKIFDTYASRASSRSASDSGKQYQTDSYATRSYEKSGKKDLADANTELPSGAQARPYLVKPKAEGGVSRFTQNLSKELTIDDVRDLLNKGKGE